MSLTVEKPFYKKKNFFEHSGLTLFWIIKLIKL